VGGRVGLPSILTHSEGTARASKTRPRRGMGTGSKNQPFLEGAEECDAHPEPPRGATSTAKHTAKLPEGGRGMLPTRAAALERLERDITNTSERIICSNATCRPAPRPFPPPCLAPEFDSPRGFVFGTSKRHKYLYLFVLFRAHSYLY